MKSSGSSEGSASCRRTDAAEKEKHGSATPALAVRRDAFKDGKAISIPAPPELRFTNSRLKTKYLFNCFASADIPF
jgi:hypothetical protein